MSDPRVSFVVPCYRLAHLLGECIQSILAQSYEDFEVLVMDDNSPDNTEEVALSFNDPRIKYVRNDPNLGHLRNYNKGIGLSRGAYVWLISADDCLASPYVLERYMTALEANPRAGYAFCPALGRQGDKRTGILQYTYHEAKNAIFDGRKFLTDSLLKENGIAAASGLVRKECYEQISLFPLDMPYGGDWYLWAVFALHYDVAYFAEPMVEYRVHDLAMCATLSQESIRKCIDDDLVLHRRIGAEAERLGFDAIVGMCREQNAIQFGRYLSGVSIRGTIATLSVEEMTTTLNKFIADESERKNFAALAFAKAGDRFFWRGEYARAGAMYQEALRLRRFWPAVLGRSMLASGNASGLAFRKVFLFLHSLKLRAG
jgi:glycosyltransferase involved in cell wall biosynthesis